MSEFKEIGKALGVLKKDLLGPVEEILKPAQELFSIFTKPLEDALRDTIGEVVYRQLTTFGEAHKLDSNVDPAKLLETVKRQLRV
ncbi:hypothetical protein Pisl_0195 [Pyrobaculum islandicum DSM 4184]|uniref:Uncharacterized protein n=1 Tax=Pyrobaculum islandicum (strain DSM 4184 / JCM 9189 / GEO3) TaxID=384616 RepID=A1RQZ5_PYRIL|nr:hypothetical protein [Pyrobaculum islandicum]ABL87377.1 hypothetical protein Pisl_0195 [Pyrobaculum islandicum DSM 4184]